MNTQKSKDLLLALLLNVITWYAFYILVIPIFQSYLDVPIRVKTIVMSVQAQTETLQNEPTEMKEWIKWYTESKGLNWKMTACVIKNESGFNDKAWNANTNDTIDVGIFQGNSIHFKHCDINCMLDYKEQTRWAVAKRLKDGSWKAWYGAKFCN